MSIHSQSLGIHFPLKQILKVFKESGLQLFWTFVSSSQPYCDLYYFFLNLFIVVRALNISSLNSFLMHNTMLLTIGMRLYRRSLELTHFV